MIKIYNGAKVPVEGLIQYQDLKIEEEQDQLNVVSFNVPREEADLIEHEGYVEVKNNGRYIIKEKNYDDDDQVYEIVGLYDLEELQGFIESVAYVSMTLTAMMDILLAGTGWTFVTNDVTIRTSTGVTIDRLDLIYAIVRDTFGLEIKFDNQTRIIFADEMLGEDKGAYFSDEVNLTALTVDSDSYDFATRIIPRGKDGLSIEAINGGLPYLENLTYSSKIIIKYWSDERYTVLENLKAEAQKKLDAICKPLMSYSAKAQDLYRTHAEDFGRLEYNVSDTITLINKETNTKEKQRIVKRLKHPDVPEDDTVTIANRIRSFISESQEEFDGVKQDFSVIRASLQLLDEKVIARVTQNVYTADKEAMDLAYSQMELDIDGLEGQVLNLDGDIGTLALTANELTGRMQNAEGDIGALELTATNFEISLGSVEDDVAGVKVQITPDAIIETVESAVSANGSTVLATKSDITQTDEFWQAQFKSTGSANHVRNGNFANGLGDFVYYYFNNGGGVALRNDVWTGYENAFELNVPYTGYYGSGHTWISNLTVGKTYTVGCLVAGHRGANGLQIFNLADNTAVAYSNIATSILGGANINDWKTIQATFVATDVTMRIRFVCDALEPNAFFWIKFVRCNEGSVLLPYSPHPSEIYDGVTKIDKYGVNVGISTSDINTQISYNGLAIRDGGTDLAVFGQSGVYVPSLTAPLINGNVMNLLEATVELQVGNGYAFPTVTAALASLGRKKILANGAIVYIYVYGSISDNVYISGFMGDGLIVLYFYNGATINGSIAAKNNSVGIYIGSSGSSVGMLKRTDTNAPHSILLENTFRVEVNWLNINGNGASTGVCAMGGGDVYAVSLDIINVAHGLRTVGGGSIKSRANRGNCSELGVYIETGHASIVGTVPNGVNGGYWANGGTVVVNGGAELDSAFSPPAVTAQIFSSTFGHTSVYTVTHDTASADSYYGASAAQNRWDSSMQWKDGVFTFGGDIYNYWQGGYNVLVEMRVRRKNSSHGSSGGVAPAPYNFAPSESFNAVGRGIWTEWTTVPSSVFGSGGATLKFYNGVSGASGYAIWDAAEVKVTVTKNV